MTCLCYAGIAAVTAGCSLGRGSSNYALWTSDVTGKPTNEKLRKPVRTNIRVADMEARNGFHADARKHYEAALKHDPRAADAIVGIAKLDEQARHNSQAERGYRKALDYDPKSIEATLGLARIDHAAGRNVRAEQGFKKAINLQPENAEAHASLGMYFAGMKRWEEAIARLRQASTLNPKSSQFRYNLAKVMVYSGDLQGAMPHFVVTVGEAAGRYNMGYILQEQGHYDDAERQYRMALAIKPDLQEARQMLSELRRGPEQDIAFAGSPSRNATRRPYDDQMQIRPMSYREPAGRVDGHARAAGFEVEQRDPIRSPRSVPQDRRYDETQHPIQPDEHGDNKYSAWPASNSAGREQPPYEEIPISSPIALRKTLADERDSQREPAIGVSPFAKPGGNSDVDLNSMTPQQREQWANQQ